MNSMITTARIWTSLRENSADLSIMIKTIPSVFARRSTISIEVQNDYCELK